MKCRQRCELSMSTYEGEYVPRMLAEIYNYLQFSYYKSENSIFVCYFSAIFLWIFGFYSKYISVSSKPGNHNSDFYNRLMHIISTVTPH